MILQKGVDLWSEWILAEILKSNLFNWIAKSKSDWQIFPSNWIKTKYQKKAATQGRVSVYLNFVKA